MISTDLRDFWARLQRGIEVAVASSTADELLGVRDGLLRYFQRGLGRDAPVAVVPHPTGGRLQAGLPLSDAETIDRARRDARALADQLGDAYHFYISTEGGLQGVEVAGTTRWTVRSWAVVVSAAGEALGASAAVEIPPRLLAGLREEEIAASVPGTRRRGGMIASLTEGMENRRTAVAASTAYALASLFYGVLGRGRG